MSDAGLSNKKKQDQLVSLVKQLCEIGFFREDLKLLNSICRENITFYSNFSQGLKHGIMSFESLQLHKFIETIIACSLKYEIINVNIDADGGGQVVLTVSPNKEKTFHIIANIVEEKNREGQILLLLSQVHIFYELKLGKNIEEQKKEIIQSSNIISGSVDIKEAFSRHGGTCGLLTCYWDDKCSIRYADDRFLKHFGYESFAELEGIDGINYLHPNDVEEKVTDVIRQREQGDDFAVELRLRKKDGSYVWVGAIGTFSYDNENREIFHVIFIDIQNRQEEINSFFQFMQNLSGGFAVYEITKENKLNTVYSSSSLCEFLKIGLNNTAYNNGTVHSYNDSAFVEDITKLHLFLRNALEKDRDTSFDFCVTLQNESPRWLNASVKAYRNAYGEKLLHVVYLDITEQKNTSDKLHKIYEEIQGRVLVCAYDEKWNIKECPSSFYEELGYTKLEAINLFDNSFLAMTYEDYREDLLKTIETQIEQGNTFSTQICVLDKAGICVYFLMTGELDKHESGNVLDFLLINISKVKRQEIMLDNANREINQLYDNIPGTIIRCKANLLCTLEFANKGFYELIGYSKKEFEELFQSTILNVIHPDDVTYTQDTLKKCINHGDRISVEYRILPKNASPKWINVDGILITNENGVSSLYCTCSDITEHHEMINDLTIIREKMNAVIRDTDLRYWDYFPSEDRVCLMGRPLKSHRQKFDENFPESIIAAGFINPVSADEFRSLHKRVKAGEPYVEGAVLVTLQEGMAEEWRKVRYTTIFDDQGKPSIAIGTSENITEYKEVERRLSIVASQIGIDTWTYDIENKVITQYDNTAAVGVNKAYIENVPESIIALGIIYKDDIDKYRKVYRQLEQGVPHLSCDLRVKSTTTNEFRWTRLFYTILSTDNKYSKLAIGSALDISELKLTEFHYEDEMRLWNMGVRDALLYSVINVTDNTVTYRNTDKKLGIRIRNSSAQDLFNSLATHIIGSDGQNTYNDFFTIENLAEQFKNGMRTHFIEFKIILGNFGSLWVSLSITMIKNPVSSEIIGFLAMKDITKAKIYEEFTHSFINDQFDCIFRVHYNTDTYQLYSADRVKPLFASLNLGGSYHGDVTKLLKAITVEEDLNATLHEVTIERFLERFKTEDAYDFPFRMMRSPTDMRYKRLRFFQKDDVTESICVGCLDVTEMYLEEERRIETLREALAVAKHANESKSSFLASVSHDIRTPMNAIIGMTNLAIEDQENVEQVAESLGVIKSSSEHLLALLNDILEMSRLESGKIVFEKEPFSIKHECMQIHNIFKGIIVQKGLKMDFECVNIRHDRVISDVTRFNRILSNLLGNAVKFTPAGGQISMQAEEIDMRNDKTAFFRITIKDSGIGISKELLTSIFEPFKREASSTVNKIEGTGLGLAIVKALVDGQGGAISVYSEIGQGATFIVELPMLIDETAIGKEIIVEQQMKMKDVDLASKHILLIDDHPINILVASKMLAKMGAVISTASDGKEGFEKFYESPPGTFSLIFMDLQMPVMNGHESTIAIRNSDHPEAKTIPIVAMTANAFAEDIRKCKISGMNCHVAKPITVEGIAVCLANLNLIYI